MMKQLLIATALLLPAWSGASAQEDKDLRVRVGAGVRLQPRYPGADHDKLGPLFSLSIAHGTEPFKFRAFDDSASVALVSSNGISFGPAANYVGSRRDSDVGAPVGRVGPTVELGAFGGYRFGDFRLRGEILQGVGGHKAVRGQIGLDHIWRDGDRYVFSIGPRILLGSAKYERAYFGVTPAASLASGLPTYRPGTGIYGAAVTSGLHYELGPHWGLMGYARYERLLGDAAKSPIVRRFGSRDQLSGGIGLSYVFAVKR